MHGQVRSIWAMAIPGGLAIAVLVFVGFVTGMLYAQRRGGGVEQVGVGWALCTMLLISPLVWWFYLTWLLPAFVACLTMALRSRRRLSDIRRWGPLAPLALAYQIMWREDPSVHPRGGSATGRKRRAPSGAPDNRTTTDQVCHTRPLPQGLRESTRVEEVASGHDRTVYDAPSSLGERWSAQESSGFSRGEWSNACPRSDGIDGPG